VNDLIKNHFNNLSIVHFFLMETILHSNKRISCELQVIEYDDYFFFTKIQFFSYILYKTCIRISIIMFVSSIYINETNQQGVFKKCIVFQIELYSIYKVLFLLFSNSFYREFVYIGKQDQHRSK